jgi:hypothetical protein
VKLDAGDGWTVLVSSDGRGEGGAYAGSLAGDQAVILG